MQLELNFKKEYVCEIPSRRLKHYRHILRKDNAFVHLSYQVTDVTASDIRNFATNLRIYKPFYISNLIPNNERYQSTANIFNYIYLSFNTKLFTLNWVEVGCLIAHARQNILDRETNFVFFLLANCIS